MSEPGVGIHAHRTLGLATFDVVATAAVALAVAAACGRGHFPAKAAVAFVALVALGVAVHAAFGVRTALNRALGVAV